MSTNKQSKLSSKHGKFKPKHTNSTNKNQYNQAAKATTQVNLGYPQQTKTVQQVIIKARTT